MVGVTKKVARGKRVFEKKQDSAGCLVGAFFESVETQGGTVRVQRHVRLGDARNLTKPLARRALREFVDKANNYQPAALKS